MNTLDKFVKTSIVNFKSLFFLLFGLLSISASAQYCTVFGDCSGGQYIDNFQLNSISNLNSGGTDCFNSSYSNTGLSTTLNQGETYSFTINGNTGTFQTFAIWIDLNNDSTFSSQEMVWSFNNFSTGNPITDSITIPQATAVGPTKMRVRSNSFVFFNGFEACSSFLDGEIEDYTVNLQPNTNPPTVAFLTPTPNGCTSTFQFFDQSTLSPNQWLWDFGDGTTDTVKNPIHTYTGVGTYTVSLIATNQYGSDTLTKSNYISISNPPAIQNPPCVVTKSSTFAGFGITNFRFGSLINPSADAATEGAFVENICNPDTFFAGSVQQLRISCNQPASHNVRVWLDVNNDGQFSNSSELIYSADNVLNVSTSITIPSAIVTNQVLRLRVMADDNFSWSGASPCDVLTYGQAEDYAIYIKPSVTPPAANFTISPTQSCDGEVQFTDGSINAPSSWLWDFGDGNTSTLPNPKHTYQNSGVYSVSLTVTNSNGNDTETKVNSVTVDKTKQLVTGCTPNIGQQLQGYGIFQFSFHTLNNNTGGSEDGYQDYSCTNNTTVTSASSYSVSINTSSTNFEDVKIFIDLNNNGAFSSNEEVFFSASKNTHSGSIFIPANATFDTYLRMRVFADGVGLIGGGCGSSQFSQIEDYGIKIIKNPNLPTADFAVSAPQSCSKTISFSENTSGVISNKAWDFGDGNTSTQTNPSHTYSSPGVYTTSLIVSNTIGSDTIRKEVDIDFGFCDTSVTPNASSAFSSNCYGSLFDSGGPNGNYLSNTGVFNISPVSANTVSIRFISFDLNTGDWLRVFDGPDTNATLIGSYTGNTLPSNISSSTGEITIKEDFISGTSGVGYHLVWNCQTPFSIPTADFIADSTNSCSGVITFTDLSTNLPSTRVWEFGDGNTSTDSVVTHQYISPGAYDVKLIVQNPAGSDSIIKSGYIEVNKEFCSTSVNELFSENRVNVFPNPATNQLTVMWQKEKPRAITLFDLAGKPILLSENSYGNKTILDLRTIPPGLYFLRIKTSKSIHQKRIVKVINE